MLELPEVEVVAERLRLALTGQRLLAAQLGRAAAFVATADFPAGRLSALVDARVRSITRQGRDLVIAFDDSLAVVFSFGSAGRVTLVDTVRPQPDEVIGLQFDAGRLSLCEPADSRRCQVALGTDPRLLLRIGEQGPDPLGAGFGLDRLRSLIRRRDRPLRHLLTDNRSLAGLGPACADEILFEARLSPFETSAELSSEETIRLHMAIKKVLQAALVHYRGLPPEVLPDGSARPFLRVHRRRGQACLVCGTPIRLVRDNRALANYCPHCQTVDTILSDRAQPM